MLRLFRALRRDEDGQALILGVVVMLVLAIALFGILNLSTAVHERIQLQNAADNAAYSMAVYEARAFNFFAYSNRAQVAGYVTMMHLMSVEAMTRAFHMLLGDLTAALQNIANFCTSCLGWICVAAFLTPYTAFLLAIIRGASSLARAILGPLRALGSVMTAAMRVLHLFVGAAVPILQGLNGAHALLAGAMMASVEAKLISGEALRIAQQTSPNAQALGDVLSLETALKAINALRFSLTQDLSAWRLFGDGGTSNSNTAPNYARRGLGELVSSTRNPYVYDRTWPALHTDEEPSIAASLQRAIHFLVTKIGGIQLPGHTFAVSQGPAVMVPNAGNGAEACKPFLSAESNAAAYGTASRYPNGHALLANQYVYSGSSSNRRTSCSFSASTTGIVKRALRWLRLYPAKANEKYYASVASTGKGGFHCGWTGRLDPLPCTGMSQAAHTCESGGHRWFGFTPYMNYSIVAPGKSRPSFDDDFNQPEVWVGLYLPVEKTNLGAPGEGPAIDVEIDGARASNVNSKRAAKFGGVLPDGMNVFSRASVYYHRPGNWKEHPNFFNPFWRARLAPIEEGLSRVPVLGDFLAKVPNGLKGFFFAH